MKNSTDYKTLIFYKLALSIGAVKDENTDDIDIKKLLTNTFLFLSKDKVLTKKQEREFNVFKDRYNLYLKYCEENDLVDKNIFKEIKTLNTITVPDMSGIKVPNLEKELKENNLDIDKIAELFTKLNG